MNEDLELLWKRFTDLFKENSETRIEDFLADHVDLDKLTASDRDELVKELIFLELDLRYAQQSQIDRAEYEKRFPKYLDAVGQAVDRLMNLPKDTQPYEPAVAESATNDVLTTAGVKPLPESVGRFQEVTYVGKGSFGIVCRALDVESNELRALKFPRPSQYDVRLLREQLRRETAKSLPLDHPHIVKTYGLEEVDDFLFVVQQFVDGSDLKQTLRSDRSLKQKVELVAKIADGLHHAHCQELVHCDLKPANVLIDQTDQPLIADFGLAFLESEQLEMSNVPFGTWPYMSPQMIRGLVRDSDYRTDLFSLGVILYELLSGRKPFQGPSKEDLVRQIEHADPTPLKRVSGVDSELDRICLKCLSKAARDRYSTAQDLADDLRYWVSSRETTVSQTAPTEEVEVVLKGLRPYEAKDSQSFLQLLPGPRARDSFPESIQFWTERISEPVPIDDRVPVGFILGPSGSGKSSFVRAGLIPCLDESVEPIYVESTVLDTEVRLIRALRKRFENIPHDLPLQAILAGLARGKWQDGEYAGKKLLIVLDQFEQRLSQNDEYDQSQLVRALEHCDGKQIQAILLCRDDFWMAATRFADALEMDIREGLNSQSIDLFDQSHGRRVLIKFGQHLGKLPSDESEFSSEQTAFVDQAIDQLARDNFIICVRLTLFVEMFKQREWTEAELKSVGGVAGVGEQFLESTFGENSNSKFRSQRKLVQAILEELLPESGRDIRGAMKTEAELIAAAKCENRQHVFKEVINGLDTELKLITRTDPDSAGDISVSDDTSTSDGVYYQLTHDYLVPSIRNWLNTELKNTRRGRALIRLRELAAQVVPGQKPKYLPSAMEWLYWQFSIRREIKTENESEISRVARNRFLFSASILVGTILAVSIFLIRLRNEQNAAKALDDLLRAPYSEFSAVLANLDRFSSRARIETKLDEKEWSADQRDRIRLGELIFGGAREKEIVKTIVDPTSDPAKVLALANGIVRYGKSDLATSALNRIIHDSSLDSASRFRALAASIIINGKASDWSEQKSLICKSLANEPVVSQREWIQIFLPIGDGLRQDMELMFLAMKDRLVCRCYAIALAAFQREVDKKTAYIADLILQTNHEAQFDSIFSVVMHEGLGSSVKKRLATQVTSIEHSSGNRQANLALGLLRLGDARLFLETLANEKELSDRSCLIFTATDLRVPTEKLLHLWNEPSIQRNGFARQGLLMILAERVEIESDRNSLQDLASIVRKVCLEDDHAGCFSTAELIVRRLNYKVIKSDLNHLRSTRKNNYSENGLRGQIWISQNNVPFRVFRKTETGLPYSFAVSTEELNASLVTKVKSAVEVGEIFTVRSFLDLYQFCNKLSDKEGLDQAFELALITPLRKLSDLADPPLNLEETGYRLLTKNEIILAGLVLDDENSVFGPQLKYLDRFVHFSKNAQGEPTESAMLLPNSAGLFDLFGNRRETFFDKVSSDEGTKLVLSEGGQSAKSITSEFSSRTKPLLQFIEISESQLIGCRVARTMVLSN